MAPKLKISNISKWSKWDRQRKIDANIRCINCGCLVHWRRNKSQLCQKCSGKANSGEKASNWKGGRVIDSGGYVRIYHPKPHHRRFIVNTTGYVLEHILVWEKANNKLLPDDCVIHHLNGIKTDNRPKNLVAISPKDHGGWTYSQCLQKRIRELEAILGI